MKVSKILLLSLLLCLLSGVSTTASAQPRHAAFLHALSDLKLMRAYLSKPTPDGRIDNDQAAALAEIDAAIQEINQASIDDGRNPNARVPADATLPPADRWRHAREAGDAAWHDLDREEDNDFANGLKHRAMGHIEKANHIVDRIIKMRNYQ